MMTRSVQRSLACIMLVSMAAIPLGGCESIQEETGFNKQTQEGAAGGAAFGGIVAALADANPALIAASIILGGVAGGAIGDHLGKSDAEKHATTNLRALDSLGNGQSESWSDARTGNSGSTTVTKVAVEPDGKTCKSYVETVRTGAKTVTEDGTACRPPGGTWHVAES
jgi:surface antigen